MVISVLNPNLPDLMNFVPFGMMWFIYSIFAINLNDIHEHNLNMICTYMFLNKA